ncbi:hypothetical protein CR203_06765 [Salipaludibacillus neizhouensis]|uniref:Uncharacterized protein n=1 Tax=Salipaludibacillus neizhouensis TaxID=885475 RepID=A0A3A9KEX3_9BACI|nr:hypothetical protein [Salipaludibacillus neizhouensis]RKL68183.1 hypothetical protein CR203_06765 [Salipaludibacillus neizhouensis]
MGVVGLCSVTVQITAIDGVDLLEPVTVFANVEFPAANGFVDIEVLGVPVEVDCPAMDFETTIDVAAIGLVTLLIQAEEV